jgi:hypothetical protein
MKGTAAAATTTTTTTTTTTSGGSGDQNVSPRGKGGPGTIRLGNLIIIIQDIQ